ncbi:hypothetical protein AEP_00155 [Curvibacter sp. AEP1-3]|jgi:hypothetical protein|uniref:hypothetical protein n=1 Tax=Curvibacter sp. AEP1-3 TaxID=1844971 RepID=UPI000B3C48EA|nr:hypothetical protein [Curvibacter sp. AEP1-3]ARV17119.1 hypothetical protein AEP_00155 [Curvibacter sp. AEP1-3]
MKDSALLIGISDAIGFVAGAQMGLWLGQSMGFDAFAGGFGNNALVGMVLLGLGGGLGLQLASRWRSWRAARKSE